jgi:hypothetical protein
MTSVQLGLVVPLLAALAQGQDPHGHHKQPPAEAGGWVRFRHDTAGFSVEHPADWKEERSKASGSVHFAHPSKAVHLFASAFDMAEGSLEKFAELKFAVQSEMFKAQGSNRRMEGPGWNGLVQEAETLEVQGGKHARRLMLCAAHAERYVSLTLYMDEDELTENAKDYERIFSSLRFGE